MRRKIARIVALVVACLAGCMAVATFLTDYRLCRGPVAHPRAYLFVTSILWSAVFLVGLTAFLWLSPKPVSTAVRWCRCGSLLLVAAAGIVGLRLGIDAYELQPRRPPTKAERELAHRRAQERLENAWKQSEEARRKPFEDAARRQRALEACSRGIGCAENGEFEQAVACFNEALELDPKCVEAYLGRGGVHFVNGESEKAVAEYTKVIELRPQDARGYDFRGIAYGDLGEFDKAISDFTTAIRLNPDYGKAYYDRGFAHAMKGELREAVSDFNEAVRLNPHEGRTYYDRGLAHRLRGDQAKAEADFAKAKQLGYEPE